MIEKMLAGEPYHSPNFELSRLHMRAQAIQEKFNAAPALASRDRDRLIRQLLKEIGENSWIAPPFYCDYGKFITIGKNTFINFNCLLLDGAEIVIGDAVILSPGVKVLTSSHPIEPHKRGFYDESGTFVCELQAKPIVINDHAWIGAGSTVLPGVEIGENSVIGAGSVVTKSIPPNVVAMGNPCRVYKDIPKKDQKVKNEKRELV